MNRSLIIAGALFLTGCGLSEEKFATQYAEAICAWYDECGYIAYAGGDVDTCISLQEAAILAVVQSDTCEYDAGAAKDCVKEAEDATCEGTGDTGAAGESACDDVCPAAAAE